MIKVMDLSTSALALSSRSATEGIFAVADISLEKHVPLSSHGRGGSEPEARHLRRAPLPSPAFQPHGGQRQAPREQQKWRRKPLTLGLVWEFPRTGHSVWHMMRHEARGMERISHRCSKIKEEKHFQGLIQNSEVRILP